MHKTSKSIYAMIMAVLMLLLSGCIDGYDRDKISDDIQDSKANAANKIKDFEDATMNLLAFGDYISPDVIRKFRKSTTAL